MNFLAALAEDGEILLRGRNVMRGFLDDPEATAAILDPDGWLHSGDLGRFDPDGHLRITGRKKDVVVTAGGKNVAPGHLEQFLRTDPLVADAVVIGDDRPCLVALLRLRPERLRELADLDGLLVTSPEEALEHASLRARIDELLAACNRRLDPFHQVKAVAVVADLETPGLTARARRADLEARYRPVLARLYGE